MNILVAQHRGFCSGVKRSIRLAQKVLSNSAPSIHILKDIVHNQTVIDDLNKAGAVRVDDLSEVNEGTIIISAHGVPYNIITEAKSKGLNVIDTTCPLVKRIQQAARGYTDDGYTVVLFGDSEHDEVKGIKAVSPDNIKIIDSEMEITNLPHIKGPVALISQSTSSLDRFDKIAGILKGKHDSIVINNTICRATRLRQESAHRLAQTADMVIVLGSKTSANSNRLAEIAQSYDKKTYLINNAGELKFEWFSNITRLGITSGASTPESLLQELLEKIKQYLSKMNITYEISEI